MTIAYKLYSRMTDMAEDLALTPMNAALDCALVNFQDQIGWPFKASQEQIDDWNAKHLYD